MIRLRAGARHATLPALLLLGTAVPSSGQKPAGTLTLERIHASSDLHPGTFGPARWRAGDAYTTVEKASKGAREIVRYDAATGKRTVLVSAADLTPEGRKAPLEIEDYAWSEDGERLLVFTNTERVWRRNTRGDYWVLELDERRLTKLGGDAPESTLMFAKFSPDGERVGYVRYDENDLYVEDLAGGEITRLTEDGSRTTINGTFDWVYEEEFDDRDGWRWSPDGERIAYWQLDASGVRDFLLMNVTDSLYSFTVPVQYPKAGTTNSAARVGVIDADGGETTWIDLPGDPRERYVPRMQWAASSDAVMVQQMNRLQSRLTVWLADPDDGEARAIYEETSDAWIDAQPDPVRWLDDGESFLWLSDRDGWRRLWRIARDGEVLGAVTPPETDVIGVEAVDEDGEWAYWTASPEDPTRAYLWRSRTDGSGKPERLTPDAPGVHRYDVSPTGEWAIHTASSFGVPPTVDLVRLPAHRTARVLEDNAALKKKLAKIERGGHEFFRVEANGVEIDGWIMTPPGFDPEKRYPVLFYVYGEPAGQRVMDRWDGTNWLWHLLLTRRGYVVASVDPRGTPAPRGVEWRKTIYQRLGTLTSKDIDAAARATMEARPWIDPDRVAIWGWSGGGSQTLNAMFRYPGTFDAGIAIAPVPDVRLYDTIYQERYLGLPQESPEVYEKSSPITYAENLEGDLLVVHGTGDDNVHWQGTARLVNALVEANRPFEMMVYPNRTHGIREGKNTRLHLYSLMTRFLEEHVEPGPEEPPAPAM